MRFMMLPAAEPARCGALLALDGPTPPAAGVRASFAGGPPAASEETR